ncbi:4e37a013-753b-4bbd-8097-f63214872646 [Thermothielavioides terrestris]|uniref:4e37a013-753b-4bbd-8097-f63214872646 n=1 Tax=Thermothielavioides terrestris TaxID=2587410 RepID=A0A3S4C5F4_9PEZI|nr:4e37a013-753b-4bbd-8097-f63214872646 [Thermothielavioides terrestris]
MSKINTILFDCDNTLVLSEELAFEGCADLINEIATAKQVPLQQPFTGETLIIEFVGQNFRGMMTSLQQRYGFELGADELDDYVRREEDVVIAKLREKLVACPGVDDVLARLAASGRYRLAVVSSSALRRVKASVEKVGQAKYFGDDIFSAATSLPTPTSKPNPAIYLYAMEKLGKKPGECVAVEDSKSGTLSATRAGIKVIGYVGPYEEDEREKMIKVLREAGAVVVMEDWSQFDDCLAKIEKGEV